MTHFRDSRPYSFYLQGSSSNDLACVLRVGWFLLHAFVFVLSEMKASPDEYRKVFGLWLVL